MAKARAPRLPRFSPTKLGAYRACPRAYAFQYDQGLRWGGINAAQSLGGSVHRALQVFHDAGGHGALDVDALKSKLSERWSDAGYATPDEAEAQRAAAVEMIERYHAAATEPGRETLASEVTVSRRYDRFVLFGKIDRLDRRPDGALEVIDYKSGRRAWTVDDVRGSLALAVYQLLVAREHPGEAVYTGVLQLRTGEGVFVLRDAAEVDAVEREVVAEVERALDDDVKAPTPGRQCRECPYTRLCPEGRAWLRDHDAG